MKIAKNMIIADVLKKYPSTAKVFDDFNMGCLSCLGIQTETLEKGCLMHGIDVNQLVQKLEEAVA